MTHITIAEQLDGKTVEWMEKVSDAQYSGAVRDQGAGTGSSPQPRPSQRAIGDFAPKLAELTDNVLYADVWERPELSKRDRSLATVGADCLEPPRPTGVSSPHRPRKRSNAGGVNRDHHLRFLLGGTQGRCRRLLHSTYED